MRVVIKDRSGRFVWVSDNVPARHGFRDPAEMIGLDDRDINPPALADVYWHDDSSVMESGQPLLAKIEVSFDEAGLPDWFVVNKIPLRDRRGRVCGLIATIVPHHGLAAAPITCTEVVIATAHIKANLGARLRLGDVAALTAVSVRHLQRLFVVSTGLTFSEYVTRCRVMEACRLLRETTMALGRIAIAVGFYDQSAFNRAFVRYVPLRPLAYRKATSRARTALTSPSVRAAPGSRP